MELKRVRKPSMDFLRDKINDAGGITIVSMGWLRQAAGWEKLGKHVVTDISNKLGEHKIGFLGELGLSQDLEVRVYNLDHPIGDLIEAVLNPSKAGDNLLREASSNDAAEILNRIRSMVCGSTE